MEYYIEYGIDDFPDIVYERIPCPSKDLVVGKRYYLKDRGGFFSRRIVEIIEIDLNDDTALVKEIADERDINGVSTPGVPHFHDPNTEIHYYVYLLERWFYEYMG